MGREGFMSVFLKIIVILFVFVCVPGFSSTTTKVYTVGVEAIPFMPYSEVVNKKYRGILRDILDSFAEKQGISFKYKPLPIKRLYTDFYNKKLDFKLPANEYWQKGIKQKRKLTIRYSKPLVYFLDGLMVKGSKMGVSIDGVKKIGVVSGFTPWEYLGKIKEKKISKRENPSIVGLLEQGLLGRVDAVYVNVLVGKHYLREVLKKEKELVFAKGLPHTKSAYHIATQKHVEVIEKLNLYLEKNQDKIAELKNKYKIKEL